MQATIVGRVFLWVAVGLFALAAILEIAAGEYLKAAATGCMALAFVFLPLEGTTAKPRWRAAAFYFLMLLWLGLYAYRLAVQPGV